MVEWQDDIDKYRKGELSATEMHALERKALRDPFLAEALQGADSIPVDAFSADISALNQKLKRKTRTVWFVPLRVAAGIILLSGISFLVYQFIPDSENIALVSNAPRESPPPVTADSSNTLAGKSDTQAQPDPKLKIKGPSPIATEPAKISPADKTLREEELTGEEEKADDVKETQVQPIQQIAGISKDEKKIVTDSSLLKSPESLDKGVASGASRRKEITSGDLSGRGTVKGKVISAEDGTTMPGVNVSIKGTTRGSVTDLNGNYSIAIDNPDQHLVFSFIGRQSLEVAASDPATQAVQLQEDATQLSEVVVTGLSLDTKSSADRSPVVKLAAPVGGVKAYDQYLESNLHYPDEAIKNKIKGKVVIEFTVLQNGQLDEFNVIRGIGHGCEEEVIRLVKQGPKWSPTTEDNVPVESNVRVKLKFDPAKANK